MLEAKSKGGLFQRRSGRNRGVEQVTQQAGSDGGGEGIVKDHDPFSSKPVAGVGEADGERKKAEHEAGAADRSAMSQ